MTKLGSSAVVPGLEAASQKSELKSVVNTEGGRGKDENDAKFYILHLTCNYYIKDWRILIKYEQKCEKETS